ncbi:MAG: EamA family transporter, partial [Lachnospiraceae bacterium]|nr:EamA family transporter [Lachnospiraceae bacterium]
MTKKENNIVLFSITLCWAASYIFIKSLPEDLSSYAYLTLTTGIAAIIMSIVFFKRLKEIKKATLWKGFFLALLMCGNLLAEKAGISLLPSSTASFIAS